MCNMIKADEIDFSIKYHPRREVFVVKKDGTLSPFNINKVIKAIGKSAYRALTKFTVEEQEYICQKIINRVDDMDTDKVHIQDMHNMVEQALDDVKPAVAKSYRDYRNYKQDFVVMMDDIYKKAQSIMFIGDKENANSDSALVSTKRALIFNQINKELYQKFFMTTEELQACRDGYIYIHDMSSRRDTMNCFRRDTRFITKDGIKSFYDFSDGDMTMVLSHKGIWRRAVVHKYGWQRIQKVTIGKQSYTSNPVEIYCTPNHRWILQDGSVTENLQIGDKLWQVPDITTFNWNDLSLENKKLWCKGFAKGDGSLADQGTSRPPYITIRLCGNKVRYAPYFQDCGYSVTKVANIENDLFVHMLDTTTKDIPWLSLDYTNIIYYINGLMCADGNRRTSKNPSSEYRGIQVTGDLNRDIYDLLNIAGYYVTNMRNLTGQTTNYGTRNKETISYGVSSCQYGSGSWRVWNIEPAELNPKAEVWCLEVEEDHSFLLEGGIPTGNCCLCDISTILMGGFEMGNVWYNEPNSLDTAFDVIGDVTLSAASQQYGGFTLPEIDKVLEPYAQKSYDKYVEELKSYGLPEDKVEEIALKKLEREFDQGFQGWEYKFNTVGSSRGDYPFITASFGLSTTRFGKMCCKSILRVRAGGQGKEGFKKPVLFPKLIFLYDENLHGEGKECEDVFLAGIDCSSKTMYPDYLSLTGNYYVSSIYKTYGRAISAMGCRAFLSPWYEKGGLNPADEDDKPIFVGRANIGVVSLHLPMILAKSRQENRDFYEVLDYYLEMIRQLHLRTYEYLGEMRASTNPLMYCMGGFYGGNLDFHDKIKPVLNSFTASFGITALNELNRLYNGKSIAEDGEFPLEVMKHINDKINEYKHQDGRLYAIYGTPAESLASLQVKQFRAKYGIIENVSDREYVSNSFHCHVTEDITPIQKQDLEEKFWNYFNGGKIQYVRYPIPYNKEAIISLVRRAMKIGYYEGVNMSLAYCDDCGHQELEMDVCPVCGSKNLTKIDRMNGYLAYSRVHGDTRLNAGKMAEIAERKST